MADPITREQVERLRAAAQAEGVEDLDQALPDWHARGPEYVREAWRRPGWSDFHAALARWRDELAAAEPVRRVARWDAGHGAYALTPPYDTPPRDIGRGDHANGRIVATPDREQAIAWGYEIEGGPIRKVARWDARRGAYVALDAHDMVCMVASDCADCIAWGYEVGDLDPALRETARRMVAALRSGSFVPSGYIALPGAAEWRVSDHSPEADARWADQLDALLGEPTSPPAPGVVPLDTSGSITIVAPAGLRLVVNGLEHAGSTYQPKPGDLVSAVAWAEAPERAPEVVDVPQPRVLVKRCDEVEAEWTSADATILIVTHDALDDAIFVPLALLRAVLEAIDAQQGGA